VYKVIRWRNSVFCFRNLKLVHIRNFKLVHTLSNCNNWRDDEKSKGYNLQESCYDQGEYFYCEKTEQYWSYPERVMLTQHNGHKIEVLHRMTLYTEEVCYRWVRD